MAEYIEREAVCSDCKNKKVCVDKSVCPVGRAPASDVEVVKHGRWLLDGRCSECLANPLTTHKTFCPNCGAKMDLEG